MAGEFRVLIDGEQPGSWNMAVDEAILMSVIEGSSCPTLRFYAWKPSCISIGYFQSAEVVNWQLCRECTIDVVRRPTGGRAVLHQNEITYSIALPLPSGQEGSVVSTFRMINQGILNGLASLGLQSAFYRGRDRRSRPQRSPLCFDAPSRYEVLIEGKKILGSAQVRKNGVLLQQGSLPLEVDKKLLTAAIKIPGSPESEPSAVHIPEGLNGFMAEPCRREEIVSRLIEGFRECFRNEFITDTLTHGEVKRAEELQCDKYASSAWTLRR